MWHFNSNGSSGNNFKTLCRPKWKEIMQESWKMERDYEVVMAVGCCTMATETLIFLTRDGEWKCVALGYNFHLLLKFQRNFAQKSLWN